LSLVEEQYRPESLASCAFEFDSQVSYKTILIFQNIYSIPKNVINEKMQFQSIKTDMEFIELAPNVVS
jgi:hypothetical protein